MTRKEKIIEILKSKTAQNLFHFRFQMFSEAWYEELADAIMAIAIEVPSEEEINEYAQKEVDRQRSGFVAMNNEMPITLNVWLNTLKHSKRITAKWAINEILKRTKTE